MEKRMKNSIQRTAVTVGAACTLLAAWAAYAQQGNPQTVTQTVNEQSAANRAAAASQARVNQLDDETQNMLDDYRVALRETESFRRYNAQMEEHIKSQQEEMTRIQNDIEEIERTNREIYPLMQRMIETLDQFVKLDVPFLLEERTKRVATMKETLNRADVTTAEKFRRLLEAYTIEMEYGRTTDATEGKLGEGEAARTVTFLRVGRTSLTYQTLDGDETGYWDIDQKAWVQDNGYSDAVAKGIKVARQSIAPDLFTVPVRAAEAAAQETK
jgi:TolA-binding protein